MALWVRGAAADGALVAGAVTLPAAGLAYSTGAPSAVPPRPDGPLRLAVSRSRPPASVTAVAERLGAVVVPMGSAGVKATSVLRDEADVYLHAGGQYEWDSAAPVAVAEAAGLHASRVDGSPLRLQPRRPLSAGPAGVPSRARPYRARRGGRGGFGAGCRRGDGRRDPMTGGDRQYQLTQLDVLESEAVFILREVVAEHERPVLLFSGGKDSIVMLELARKAFHPARIPFPVLHVDTGHNFHEVLEHRDATVARLGLELVVASVQEAIDDGSVVAPPDGTRNRIQMPVLLDTLEKHGYTAIFGGARRDEDKARSKERVFSFRDEFGQWDPKNQRPELWSLYNGQVHLGESIRVFPLSNWTELDVWRYIARERISLPSIYFAHEREVFDRGGMLYGVHEFCRPKASEQVFTERVRYRTVGDASLTAAVRSDATTVEAVIEEVATTRITERGSDPRRRQVQRGRDGGPEEGGVLLMDILRFATAGSVDDGKSTLIGRLLYDTKSVLQDQLDAVERVSRERGDDYVDLALLTDGLRAEREQGITIDVAYRYFSTARRNFIIADTPGHIQYTRNMSPAPRRPTWRWCWSTPARGIVEQSRRHAFLATLLQVPHARSSASTRWTSSTGRRRSSRRSARSSRSSPRGCGCPTSS